MARPSIIAQAVFATGQTVKLWIADLNIDSIDEYVFVEGGRIVVRDRAGDLIWQSGICNPIIVGFHDLAGTDKEKCIIAVTHLRTLTVFSGSTGVVYWQYTFSRKTVMLSHNRMKIGIIDPSIKGEQITVWPEGDDFGYLFAFDAGIPNGRLVWQVKGIGLGDFSRYNPNVLIGDLEGKRQNSIIIIHHSIIRVVAASSGELLYEIDGPKMRNYGYARLFDIDQCGKPELVLVNDAVQLHTAVVKFAGNRSTYIWDRFIGYGEHVMKTPYSPVADIDGDGKFEIVYSVGDIVKGDWRVDVVSSTDGLVKWTFEHARILDCADIDQDGVFELLLEKTDTGSLVVCKVTEMGLTELFCTSGQLLSYVGPYRSLTCSHIAADRGVRYFFDVDGDGYDELVVNDKGLLTVYGMLHGRMIRKSQIMIGKDQQIKGAVGKSDSINDQEIYLLSQSGAYQSPPDGLNGNQRLVLRRLTHQSITSFDCHADVQAETPVVTDIDGDGNRVILVGDSVFSLVMPKVDMTARIQKSLSVDHLNRTENTFFGSKSGICFLAAWDFHNNGQKQLLFRNSNAELILTDHRGQTLWRTLLKGHFIGGRIVSVAVGKFIHKDHYDIFANVAATADYINECMVVESATGKVVWRRSNGHDSGMGPVDGYASVRPLEEDGLDDLLFLSGEVIAQIDGSTGSNLLEMTEIGKLLGTGWIGSGQFTLIDVDHDGQDEIVLSGVWGLNNGVLKWRDRQWLPLWFDYYGNATPIGTPPRFSHQGIAQINGHGQVLIAGPRSDYRYGCVDASNGRLLWTLDIGDALVGETCTGDVDGDGQDEFIFGCNDGHVYVVKHDGHLIHKIDVGAPPGSPILADIDSDGLIEIIVTTQAGKLLIIQ